MSQPYNGDEWARGKKRKGKGKEKESKQTGRDEEKSSRGLMVEPRAKA
jgi:hypothetical protein